MVIYFTGTGNSRYLAEILAEQLKDEIVDGTKYIQNGENPSFMSNKPYVFVAPTYAWRLPRIFENWIQRCEFSGNKKAYFVLNCGSDIGAASKYAKKLCEEKGFEYMEMAEVVMPENYIALFEAPSEAECKRIVEMAEVQTRALVSYMEKEIPFEHVKVTSIGQLCSGIVNTMFYKFFIKADKFVVKDSCISCGKCVNKCMMNNIALENGKPVWGKDCTHCMACINHCQAEAIEYGKHTCGLRRYTLDKAEF